MGLRGPKPKGKVKIEWSPNFAYAIGLIASDGCLSAPGGINFTSKDFELISNFQKALVIDCHVGKKASGTIIKRKYFVIQFKDIQFFNFLISIGITPNKSRTIGPLLIPHEYFFDFLRGIFDGDGSTYSYWDPRWRSSFMFYTEFSSASKLFIDWIREIIFNLLNIYGHITSAKKVNVCYQLKYAKQESFILWQSIYYKSDILTLSRKKLKIKKALGIMGKSL